MGAAFTEEEGRIFLRGVEVRGLDDPVVEVLAVGGLAPAGLGGAGDKLGEDVVVLVGELLDVGYGIAVHTHRIEVCGVEVVVTLHQELDRNS